MSTLFAAFPDHSLFGVALTLATYVLATKLWLVFGKPAMLQPLLVATTLLAVALLIFGLDYRHYASQTQVLSEALTLVIVLLAVPFCRHLALIRASGGALGIALVVGAAVAMISALALPVMVGADPTLVATIAPKSATAAVAIEVTERLGGIGGMTAVVVISTGLFGAIFGPAVLSAMGIGDHRAVGFALGVASHALGTARAFQNLSNSGNIRRAGYGSERPPHLGACTHLLQSPHVLALFSSRRGNCALASCLP